MKIPPPHYFKPQGSPSRGCELGAFGEKPSAAAHEVRFKVLWGAKWTFIPSPLPRQRNSLQTSKENTYICIFRTWKLYLAVDLSPFLSLGKAESKEPAVRRGGRERAVKAGDARPRGGSGALRHLCISVLRLHYSCYTNKLFRPCPEQTPECGGFIRGYIFPLASCSAIKTASQRRELTFLRYAQIEVINLFMTSTKCSAQGQDWCGRVHSCFAARLPATVYDILFWICIPFNTLDIITNAQLLNHRPWRGRMTQHTASKTKRLASLWCMFLFSFTNNIRNTRSL